MKVGAIVAWLVFAPSSDENDYYVFPERQDAEDKQIDFDALDPNHEHRVEALVIHPTYDHDTNAQSGRASV